MIYENIVSFFCLYLSRLEHPDFYREVLSFNPCWTHRKDLRKHRESFVYLKFLLDTVGVSELKFLPRFLSLSKSIYLIYFIVSSITASIFSFFILYRDEETALLFSLKYFPVVLFISGDDAKYVYVLAISSGEIENLLFIE